MVRIEIESKVDTLFKACQGVAGKSEDEVKAEYCSAFVQQGHFCSKISPAEDPAGVFQHIRVGTLQPDLQGAGDCCKKFRLLPVDKLASDLKMEMDLRGDLSDEFQDFDSPLLVTVEGGVENKDLGDPVFGKPVEFLR